MAETVLRFGPDWLRALAGGEHNQNTPVNSELNCANSPTKDSQPNSSGTSGKKIRYHYGREELFALFEKMKPRLKEYSANHGLTVERYHMPSATSSESSWSRSGNSEAPGRTSKMDKYLRMVKVEPPGTDRFDRSIVERNPTIRLRGGLTAERGRGRGRPTFYQRSSVFDGPDEPGEPMRESYRKNYERSSSLSEDGPREKGFTRSLSKGESGDDIARSRKDSRSLGNWRSSSRSGEKSNWRAGRSDESGNTGRDRHDSWRKEDREMSDEGLRGGLPIRRGYGNNFGDERIPWRGSVRNEEAGGRSNSGEYHLSEGRDSSEEGPRNGPVMRRNHLNDERIPWRNSGKGAEESRGGGQDHEFWRKDDREIIEEGGGGGRNGLLLRRDYYNKRKSWWDDERVEERIRNLPEWSLDDTSNGEARLGTFDASGAFREDSIDDDSRENILSKRSLMRGREIDKHKSVNSNFGDQRNENFYEYKGEDNDQRSNENQLFDNVKSAGEKVNILDKNVDTSHSSQSPTSSSHLHNHHDQTNVNFENLKIGRKFLPESDDGFSHLQKAAENMVAQWTAEAEQEDKSLILKEKLNICDISGARKRLSNVEMNMIAANFGNPLIGPKSMNESKLNQPMEKQNPLAADLINSQYSTHFLPMDTSRVNTKQIFEDDSLSHLEKAAESMVNQWTADDDREERAKEKSSKITVVPPYHEDAYKWFYRDPEGAIQGPFLPVDMYEWFASGYFPSNLLVKRGCDERFSPLGELVKACGGMPFFQEQNPIPMMNIQQNSTINPVHPVVIPPGPQNSLYSVGQHQQLLHQREQGQLQNQIYLNQQLQIQQQLKQILAQLQQRDGFQNLSQQDQQRVLVQQYISVQQQMEQRREELLHQQRRMQLQRHQANIPEEQEPNKSVIEQLQRLGVSVVRNTRPMPQGPPNIWGLNGGVITASALEEIQRQEREQLEIEENQKLIEEEKLKQQKRAEEEALRKREEEQIIEQLKRKLEEEKRLREELMRDAENRRKREEEEEKRRLEQQRIEIENEKRRLEEQRKRHEEMMMEEMQRYTQAKAAQIPAHAQIQIQTPTIPHQTHQQRIEPTKVESRFSDGVENPINSLITDPEKQINSTHKPNSNSNSNSNFNENQSPEKSPNKHIWGQAKAKNNTLPLALIQKLQEEKEKEIEGKKKQSQTSKQQSSSEKPSELMAAEQANQKQQMKFQLTWARAHMQQAQAPVKTLAEIQKEEALKLEKQKELEEKKAAQQGVVNNCGIWNNAASQLSWRGSAPPSNWGQLFNTSNTSNMNSNSQGSNPPHGNFPRGNSGNSFWENGPTRDVKNTNSNKSQDSAFRQSNKNNGNASESNVKTNQSAKSRKDEEVVMKLFENQRRQNNDEFTKWCIKTLNKFKSPVDPPTFVTFLKDIESPYEVIDYVKSYLGESKEAKEFANQYLEKRSFYRNQAKKDTSEAFLWGPAPAITPSVNKLTSTGNNNASKTSGNHGNASNPAPKKKKKKGKKVDSSILGFTVRPGRVDGSGVENSEK